MDKTLFFTALEQVALMMALAYLFCLLPRNERNQHASSHLYAIGFLTSLAGMLLLEHGLFRLGVGLDMALEGPHFMPTELDAYGDRSAILFTSNTIILSLVALFFGWIPLIISAVLVSLYCLYFTHFPMFIVITSLVVSGFFGLVWQHFKVDVLGKVRLIHFYGLGMSVGLVLLLIFSLAQADWANINWQERLLMTCVVAPLVTVVIGHLLSQQVFFERDRQVKLQDNFLFRNQFDTGSIGIAITSKSKYWLRVNPYICKMFQYSEKELLQMTWKELTYPEDLEKDLQYFNRMLKGEISEYEIDKRFIAKDGAIIYTHLSVACRFYDDDSFLVIAGFLDITQLKKAERALENSREQLALVLDSSDLGIWDWHIKSNCVASNLRSAQMLGCELEVLNRKPSLWTNAIIAADRKRLIKALLAIRKGHGIHHKIEYRLRSLNGDIRWISDAGKVVEVDANGLPLRMCGTHTDITELKRAEESLSIAASVYHNSSEAMSVFDCFGNIVNTNPAFSDITGFSAAEIKGQHLSVLQSEEQFAHFNMQVNQSLFEKRHWQGEVSLQRKNGQAYTAWAAINAIGELDNSDSLSVMLFSDISEKKQAEELIWLQANYDALTGLSNRRMLLEHIKVQIAHRARDKTQFALLFLDLDFFKEVNDTLGHDIGDMLLIEAASRIKFCIRDTDLVARLGGDEFTVVLNGLNKDKGIERVANKILKALSEPFNLGNERAHVSASIGVTLYPEDATTIDVLLKNADQAMYSAKAHGRNRFHYFTPKMQDVALKRMKLIQDLKVAIKLEQFELYYQPIIDFTTDNIVKAEALIRWHHPEMGFISPADFIPIAEDTGMIIEIGNWVFKQASHQVACWQTRYGIEIQISINKSPVQFRDDHNNVMNWVEILKQLNVSTSSICVEITEGLLLDAESNVESKLSAYRSSGIQVSLDDFGTGYSSLSYLKKFKIDYLKIDKSFVSNLEEDKDDLSLCEAIIVMAHKLGIKVIAEGIETEKQKHILVNAGCDYGQGYLFSKPIKATEFEKLYFAHHESVEHHKIRQTQLKA